MSIDEGLDAIKSCLEASAPEPNDGGKPKTMMEAGLSTICECLYGAPEPNDSIDPKRLQESCQVVAEWMLNQDDKFMNEAMVNINSILGREIHEASDLANVLYEGAQAFNEGLINFKIDSIDKLKEAINIIDVTPRTSAWLVGAVLITTALYAMCVLGITIAGLNAVAAGITSVAASLGLSALILAASLGAVWFGWDLVEWVTTKVYNKITRSKELPPSEMDKAIKQILRDIDNLEQKFKRAGKVQEVRRVQRLYDDIARRWGIYQEELATAAANGAMVGGMIGANLH